MYVHTFGNSRQQTAGKCWGGSRSSSEADVEKEAASAAAAALRAGCATATACTAHPLRPDRRGGEDRFLRRRGHVRAPPDRLRVAGSGRACLLGRARSRAYPRCPWVGRPATPSAPARAAAAGVHGGQLRRRPCLRRAWRLVPTTRRGQRQLRRRPCLRHAWRLAPTTRRGQRKLRGRLRRPCTWRPAPADGEKIATAAAAWAAAAARRDQRHARGHLVRRASGDSKEDAAAADRGRLRRHGPIEHPADATAAAATAAGAGEALDRWPHAHRSDRATSPQRRGSPVGAQERRKAACTADAQIVRSCEREQSVSHFTRMLFRFVCGVLTQVHESLHTRV